MLGHRRSKEEIEDIVKEKSSEQKQIFKNFVDLLNKKIQSITIKKEIVHIPAPEIDIDKKIRKAVREGLNELFIPEMPEIDLSLIIKENEKCLSYLKKCYRRVLLLLVLGFVSLWCLSLLWLILHFQMYIL